MFEIIIIIHIIAAISIIALVLLQKGQGADIGAALGGGSSNTMFGSQGPLPFLVKLTVLMTIVFFATSLVLARFAAGQTKTHKSSIMSSVSQPAVPVMKSVAQQKSRKIEYPAVDGESKVVATLHKTSPVKVKRSRQPIKKVEK